MDALAALQHRLRTLVHDTRGQFGHLFGEGQMAGRRYSRATGAEYPDLRYEGYKWMGAACRASSINAIVEQEQRVWLVIKNGYTGSSPIGDPRKIGRKYEIHGSQDCLVGQATKIVSAKHIEALMDTYAVLDYEVENGGPYEERDFA